MSWVEVDGGGWRWVHSFVIPKKLEQKAKANYLKIPG